MTVGVFGVDGVDIRLARETDLFRHAPFSLSLLENDLDGPNPLLTPRVWTSIMAGEDQRAVVGWAGAREWRMATDGLTFLWDRYPDTRVQDLKVNSDGLINSEYMPDAFMAAGSNPGSVKAGTSKRVDLWNREIADGPPVVVAWLDALDRWGHYAGQNSKRLTPAYEWFRDEVVPTVEWPDEVVVLSDHGFRVPEWNEGDDPSSWSGVSAHAPPGVVGASSGLAALREFDSLTEFIPEWQSHVGEVLRDENLRSLGYV